MYKKNKEYLFFFFAIVFLSCSILLVIRNNTPKKDALINISYLSEEFIENYFEEISKVNSNEEKANMLIVISNNQIQDSYGAVNIIEAPNNQYILQYNTIEEKNIALQKFKDDKRIKSVTENKAYAFQSDNYNSWGVEAMALNQAMTQINTNIENVQEVTVAIIDSGCDMALFNKYYNGKIDEVYDVLENSTTNISDEYGHGTHIAGTIAESTPANVKILPVKVSKINDAGTLSPKPYGPYITDIIAAVNYITYNKKADVINMSFASYTYNEPLDQAIEAAKQENIITVAAAGNVSDDKYNYPAAQDNTISVAGVDSNLAKYRNSAYGETITFTAPAVGIKSILGSNMQISFDNFNADGDDDHETMDGTSMAAPHVASAVAILKGYNKNLTLENVIDLLKSKVIDLGEEGWDQYFGYGFISFDDVEFCNGVSCDEFGVFKVDKTIINPLITVDNKIYDGTTSIPTSSISISTLDSSEYSIVSAISSNANSGEQTATIRLRLSNEKFANYAFSNGLQEKEFSINFEILKATINVTDNSKNVTVEYDGNPHSVEIDIVKDSNAIIKYMDSNNEYTLDNIPTYIETGTYTIKYKVYINDNYTEYLGQKTLTILAELPYTINTYDVDETNNYISKIMVNTEVDTFTSKVTLGNGYGIDVDTITIDNKQVLYTGGKTRITHGMDIYKEYTNIVIGDINGDGSINSADLLKIRQHLLGSNILTGVYFLSSDINYDNEINSADLLRVRQHLLGSKPIE